METSTIILASIIAVCLIYMILAYCIDNFKEKQIKKGYIAGQNEVIRSLKSTAFWFSVPENKKEFNALMLYSMIYEKWKSVDSDLYRKRIKELGDKKLTDLSQEEILNLIR